MITKVVNVNLHQPIYERLTAKQGDIASRYLLFHLLDGDKPFDLTNRSVRVYAIKPDKTEIFNDLIINDRTKGYCTLELTSQCLASAGVVKMELYISESGKVLTSIPFELEVIACINTANGVTSTNEFSALEAALGSLQDYYNLRSEIVQARKGYGTVGKRLDTIENIKQNKGFLYDIKLESVIDTYNLVPTDYYAMYDGLISKYQTMFGKHELGKDQSNQYPIYLYQYKPKNYKNTIFITCGVHGDENYTTYIMYLFLKNLLDSSQTPLQLSNLKNNTRILLMPICNPWGMFQTPKTRWNSRGIDINRNFDWNWENNPVTQPFTDNYKGTAPFSENESKYIKYVMDNYNIDSMIDIHNYPERWENNPYKYLFYGDTKTWDIIEDLMVYLKRNDNSLPINHLSSQNDSCVNNYASSVKQIPALNFELMKGQHGTYESKEDASTWLSLVQNILILLSATFSNDLPLNKLTVKNGQLNKELTNASWVELSELGIEYNADYEGILSVDGWLTVSNTLDTDVLTIDPIIEQEGNYTIKPDVNRLRPNFYGKKMYVPFNVKLPIIKSDNKATFKLKVINEGTGVCTVNRYMVNYTFIETINKYKFIYTHNKV